MSQCLTAYNQILMTKANLVKTNKTTSINRSEALLVAGYTISRVRFKSTFMIRDVKRLRSNQPGNIYMWMYYGKKCLAFSTGITATSDSFRQDGTITDQPGKTTILKEFERRALEYYTELKITGRPIDLQLIKATVLGIHVNGIPNLCECLRRFDRDYLNPTFQVGELQKGSYKKLVSWNKHIEEWCVKKIGKNARLDQVLPADAKYFMVWLKGEKALSHNVASRIVSHLKRLLDFALENQWIDRNPLLNFRRKLEKKKLDFLTEFEMDKLETTKFASQAMDQLRDVFLFQCYTSLSYNELKNLTPGHISTVDGYAYIRISRKKTENKTDIDQIIPLVPQALQLLAKYKDHELCKRYDRCFPVQSNQKFNAMLKQIGMVTDIGKRLTSHVGRRTAATNYLNGGVPLVSVSAMLGHSSTLITQEHYTHVQPGMVVKDFMKFLKPGAENNLSTPKTA
jgi:integrase